MKKLLGILVLGLFLITPSQADDIKDFQIEGMSIGDSLLDYFSQEEIKKNIMWHYNDDKKNNEFVIVEFFSVPFAKVFDGAQFARKLEDKKYKIYAIVGVISFKYNINDCYSKMKEIESELSELFKLSEKSNDSKVKMRQDVTGESTVSGAYFKFEDGGNASVQCYDFSETMAPRIDNLKVSIRSKEYRDWYFKSFK